MVQGFYQVAIIKLTFCTSLPWILKPIVQKKTDFPFQFSTGFMIIVALQMGMVVIFMGVSVLSRFRLGVNSGMVLIVFYGIYAIVAIVLILSLIHI